MSENEDIDLTNLGTLEKIRDDAYATALQILDSEISQLYHALGDSVQCLLLAMEGEFELICESE